MLFHYGKTSFTLEGIKHLKTKEDFKKVFLGKFDVDKVWKEVCKARPKEDKPTKKKKEVE